MHDASKHTQKQHEKVRQKYEKLRDDHHVPALEARAVERLKDLHNATNNAVTEYNDQNVASEWKRPENARPRLSLLGPLSEFEKAVHERCNADQSDQPATVADANLQDAFTDSDVLRGLTEATPEQAGHSRIVADANFQDFIDSDEAKGSSYAVPDPSYQANLVGQLILQDTFIASDEVRGRPGAALDQNDQPGAVADEALQDTLTVMCENRSSADASVRPVEQQTLLRCNK